MIFTVLSFKHIEKTMGFIVLSFKHDEKQFVYSVIAKNVEKPLVSLCVRSTMLNNHWFYYVFDPNC